MSKQQKFKVKLTADEMKLIKQSIEQTAYLGRVSEALTKIKKKMTPPKPQKPRVALIKEENE